MFNNIKRKMETKKTLKKLDMINVRYAKCLNRYLDCVLDGEPIDYYETIREMLNIRDGYGCIYCILYFYEDSKFDEDIDIIEDRYNNLETMIDDLFKRWKQA